MRVASAVVYLLSEIGRAILYVCAVALPAIALWGLFFVVFYHAKLWLIGSFSYFGLGAVAWLVLCWRSPEPRRVLLDLVFQIVVVFGFMLTFTLAKRMSTLPPPSTRDIVLLVFSVLVFTLPLGIVAYRHMGIFFTRKRSNKSLQPTAGRSDA